MWVTKPSIFLHSQYLRWLAFVGVSLSISLLFSGLFAPSASALQTVPYKLNYQGRLTDSTGNVKPNGLYNIKFRLMSASSGGTNLWEGDRVRGASDYRVQVTNGLFSIQLGDTSQGDPALSPTLFNTVTNSTVYLEVELPAPATATCSTNGCATFTEGAMTPRSLLGSSAYAMNADTVDGIDGASLARNDSANTFTANNTFNSSTTSTFDGVMKVNNTATVSNNSLFSINIQGTAGAYTLQNAGIGTYFISDGSTARIGVAPSNTAGSSVSITSGSNDALVFANLVDGYSATINAGVSFANNLVENGGFEFGTSGWRGYVGSGGFTYTFEAANPRSVLRNLKMTKATSGDSGSLYQRQIFGLPGETYSAGGWLKTSAATTGTAGIRIIFFDKTGAVLTTTNSTTTNPGTTYTLRTVSAVAPANTAIVSIQPFINNDGSTGGDWFFDDIYGIRSDRVDQAIFKNAVDSTTAFQLQNAAGTSLFTADTTNSKLTIASTSLQVNSASTIATNTKFYFNEANSSGDKMQATGTGSLLNDDGTNGLSVQVSASKTAGASAVNQEVMRFTAANDVLGAAVNTGVNFGGGGNLASNGGFEFGCAGWKLSNPAIISCDNASPYLGNKQLKIVKATGSTTGNAESNWIAAWPNEVIAGLGLTKTTVATTGTGGVSICFYDKDGASLSCTNSTTTNPGTSYVIRNVTATAPANTTYAAVNGFVNSDGSTGGTWYFDEMGIGTVTNGSPQLLQNFVDSTTAFQVQTAAGAALLVADTTNLMLKVGGGDVSPNATPALLVLDYKNTAGDPTGVNGGMYYNSSTNRFRCYENSAWKDCDLVNSRRTYKYVNEMAWPYTITNGLNLDGTMESFIVNAGGVSFLPLISEANHPGIFRGTGTFNGDVTGVLGGSTVLNSGTSTYTTTLRAPTLSTSGEPFWARAGYMTAVSAATISDGCYLRVSDATTGGNAGKWQAVCVTASTATTCDTTVAVVANTWTTLKIVDIAGSVSFYVDGSGVCATGGATGPISTNVPSIFMGFGYNMWKVGGSTARQLDNDYIEYTNEGISR